VKGNGVSGTEFTLRGAAVRLRGDRTFAIRINAWSYWTIVSSVARNLASQAKQVADPSDLIRLSVELLVHVGDCGLRKSPTQGQRDTTVGQAERVNFDVVSRLKILFGVNPSSVSGFEQSADRRQRLMEEFRRLTLFARGFGGVRIIAYDNGDHLCTVC